MPANLNINNAETTNYEDIDAHTIEPVAMDGVAAQKETTYMNNKFYEQWSIFNRVSKVKSSILAKAKWNLGRGYKADTGTMVRLDHIRGYGKQSFRKILENMDVIRMVGGDAYAEIIRDPKERQTIPINLKVLDTGTIRQVRDSSGMIIRYEQIGKIGKTQQVQRTWKPEDIFHVSFNMLGDQTHGISVIEALKKQILADDKLFDNIDRLVKYQLMPFVIFKVKDDNAALISNLRAKIRDCRDKGEDLVLPDDENILSWETVQVTPSSMPLDWKQEVTNEYYREINLPQIIPGQSGQGTESDGKVIYTAFGHIVESDQMDWEEELWAQLSIKLNIIHPESLLPDLQQDQLKDANQGLDVAEGMQTRV